MSPAQLSLIQGPSDPTPHGANRYVPVVQNKKGELGALERASGDTWDWLTPLVHFVGPKSQAEPLKPGTVAAWVRGVHQAVKQRACYVDIRRVRATREVATARRTAVLPYIFERCRARNIRVIPVAPIDASTQHLDHVADELHGSMRGVALRVPFLRVVPAASGGFRSTVKRALDGLDVAPESVDLLLDLEYLACDIPAGDIAPLVGELAEMFAWRDAILIGTSIPATIGSVKANTVGCLPRREWQIWCELTTTFGIKLSFGDYCVQHPKPPQEQTGPGMYANIRYTTDHGTLVARGWGPVMKTGKEEYIRLCEKLINHDRFAGEPYSWGDELIAQCSRGEIEPGAQAMWRGAGTSHHLAFVANQLEQLPPAV